MPKATTFCNDILGLIFLAAAIADIAQDDTSSPLTQFYIGLHTADPGVGGSQTTNEATYTNYARVAVSRSGTGWSTPSGGSLSNAALIQFPQCGVTGNTLTHVSIGTTASGAGKVLYSGALNVSLAVSNLIQPQFNASALTVTEA